MALLQVCSMVTRSLALMLVLFGASNGWAADAKAVATPVDKMVWPGWQIPVGKVDAKGGLSIEPDAAAESVRLASVVKAERAAAIKAGAKPDETLPEPKDEPVALVQRVSRSEIALHPYAMVLTPQVKWEAMKPGVYRVSARIAWEGDAVLGTPIRLTINTGRGVIEKSFYSVDLEEAGKFQTISILYELDATGEKQLIARHAYHAIQNAEYFDKVYPGAKPAAKVPAPPVGFQIGLDLPLTKYNAEAGLPPNSLRQVKVDWIKMERIDPSPSITVRYVKARKVWIRPGAEQPIEVSLQNYTGESQKRVVSVNLVHGIDERTVLGQQEIDLAPGAEQKIAMTWKTTPQTAQWGYEVVAEVKSAASVEKAESSARDFFTVSQQVYPALVMGSNWRAVDPFRQNESFQNQIEVFGATRGDCAEMTVPGETWFSGMMGGAIPQSYKLVKGCTDLNREQGIATHMYLYAGGTGAPLIELYEKHPEWMHRRLNTLMDEVYRKNMEYDQLLAKQDFSKGLPEAGGKMPHAELGFQWWDPVLMDRVTKDAVSFVGKTGYDGIRFDVGLFGPTTTSTILGTTLPYDMKDAMTVAAKNFEGFSAALHKQDPNFEFGANQDTYAYLEQVGIRNVTPKPPEDFPEWIALCKTGGMLMDEATMDAPGFTHYMNRFEDALWSMRTKCATARKYGGVYQLFSPYRNGNGYFAHDDIYWSTFIIASGSVYVGRYSAPPYSDSSLGAFITRYGEFFRSKGLQPLTGADEKIAVSSPNPLWFTETAVFEDIGSKRRYVVPLINPPLAERFRRNKTGELPPPVKEAFEVRVKFPEGYQSAKAWMLTWEPTIGSKALTLKKDGDVASILFPGVDMCRTLVVEFEK